MTSVRDFSSWIELSESAYRNNILFVKREIGAQSDLGVVIKANAYGHGLLPVARMAADNGVRCFFVQTVDEALELRAAGFRHDIVTLGHVPSSRFQDAVREEIQIALFNVKVLQDLIDAARRTGKRASCHVKLETGFHRQGINENELSMCLKQMRNTNDVELKALYTHFSSGDDPDDSEYVKYQLGKFRTMVQIAVHEGFGNVHQHLAGTAAMLLFPETLRHMTRLGIGQYGLWPSKATARHFAEHRSGQDAGRLQPVLSWQTIVCQVKWVEKGSPIGYGCSHAARRRTRLAVIPVGYADGYDRGLSNRGHVLIHGKRASILGRVCMNITMVDVTDIPEATEDDEVVLLGRQKGETVTADDLGDMLDTINYEIVARINSALPRVVVA